MYDGSPSPSSCPLAFDLSVFLFDASVFVYFSLHPAWMGLNHPRIMLYATQNLFPTAVVRTSVDSRGPCEVRFDSVRFFRSDAIVFPALFRLAGTLSFPRSTFEADQVPRSTPSPTWL